MHNDYVGNFTFHPVGHGLFYTGKIKNLDNSKQFTFIYDCGGQNKDIINEAIFKADLPDEIDLLIISHFHADHIKGILELKSKYKIKTAILPYLEETKKILYISALSEEDENTTDITELKSFIQNPNEFQGNDTNVFYVDNNIEEDSFLIDESSEIPTDSEHDFEFNWIKSIRKDDSVIRENPIYQSPIWIFNFFMPKEDANFNKLKDFFKKNNITIDNAIDYWNSIKKEMKKLKLNNNTSNLICTHGPVKQINMLSIRDNKHFFNIPYFLYQFRNYHMFRFQLLTGDAEIDNQNAFINRYKNFLPQSFLFQIPHHGSKENWHDWFSEYTPFCYLWPVTHNANHKYRRGIFPSATFSYIAPYSVTEIETTRLGIQIFFEK